jgi:dTDP-4-amino-4,6-dideoxygalactose transaminase
VKGIFKMKVPFIDLQRQYESIKDEIAVAMQKVINSCAFAGGKFVEQFEKEFASFCGCKYAIGVGSGTEALWLSLLALGVGPGDDVITVPSTFMATSEAISFCGARPIFVDIDRETYNLDPVLLEKAITPRTKAIIPVHLFGQMADMNPIMEIAKEHKLFVVEDACQAHGAEYKGKAAGSIGDAGCFSFYPGKNLGAYGEAGAVVTNNDKTDRDIRMLRDHGQSRKYHHAMIGWNARMDGLQGAVLSVKLSHLRNWNERRRKNAQLYDEKLSNIDGVIVPKETNYAKHVYHVYAVRVRNRDSLIDALSEKNINCGIHYPIPVHLQEAYNFLGLQKGCFPVAESCALEFVSLPMFPELSKQETDYVVTEIKNFLHNE